MIVNNINNEYKTKILYQFKPKFDNTMAVLLVVLMLVIGMTIGSTIYNYKIAHAETSINLGKLTTGTVAGNPTIIGIQLSDTCIREVKQHDYSVCPSYKTLLPLDNSNQFISGKFITDKDGYFHRGTTFTKFHYQMYPTGSKIIMLDPDARAIAYGQTIILVTSLNYKINDDKGLSSTTGTKDQIHILNVVNRTEYHGRSVDGCKTATIVYSKFLLNDTINYLESGCTKTSFDPTQIIQMKQKPFDIKNSAAIKYQNWLKDIAQKQAAKNCVTKQCITPDNRWK